MGSLDGSELVYCVPTHHARTYPFRGFARDDGGILPNLRSRASACPRTEALERDPGLLQFATYGTVWRIVDGVPKALVYRRASAGTEGRLHDKLSLGFGGHVEQKDKFRAHLHGGNDTFRCGMRRELREELGLSSLQLDRMRIDYVGLIYSPQWDGVEAHHIGVYYEVLVGDEFYARDPENAVDIVGWFGHHDFPEIRDRFERWSGAVVDQHILSDRWSPAWAARSA
jgi:predicted NUDIX family phosphoesterase